MDATCNGQPSMHKLNQNLPSEDPDPSIFAANDIGVEPAGRNSMKRVCYASRVKHGWSQRASGCHTAGVVNCRTYGVHPSAARRGFPTRIFSPDGSTSPSNYLRWTPIGPFDHLLLFINNHAYVGSFYICLIMLTVGDHTVLRGQLCNSLLWKEAPCK